MADSSQKPATGFKTSFAVDRKLEAFYTGGCLQLSSDGLQLHCSCSGHVKVVDVETGRTVRTVTNEEDTILNFILSPDDKILITTSSSGLLKQWDLEANSLTRTWKSTHKGPINTMTLDSTVTLLATGGTDATIKVWDIVRQYCTHNLKGASGVFSLVCYHPDDKRLHLFGAAEDYHIRTWDLNNSQCISVLEGHFSTVTSLVFTNEGDQMLSAGRDQVVILWDILEYKSLRTIPVFEAVESLILVPEGRIMPDIGIETDGLHFITAGNKGFLRVWQISGQLVYTQKSAIASAADEDPTMVIRQATYNAARDIITIVTYDHTILMYKMNDFSLDKQLVGFNDDVLDITFLGKDDTHLAVATNSDAIKLFEIATHNCQLLKGHSDIVLSLDTFKHDPYLMASCSKDNTIRIWKMCESTGRTSCVAMGVGHTHAVGAIACSQLSLKFVVTGSQDTCLKLWDIPATTSLAEGKMPFTLNVHWTQIAHEKHINSVCVSPNDRLIATGSLDKTAKVWNSAKGTLLATLRGHKRGIWCVQFSPVDQVTATGSADGTIKIWSLSDYTCVKTFEGHECSVLKLAFTSRGMQILSSAADGLLKLWTIKLNECVKTMDAHEGKVWALRLDKSESVAVSGAGDSTIVFWKDVTQTELTEILEKQEQLILQEQEIQNLLQEKKYLKALGLTLTMEQPFRALNIIKEILLEPEGDLHLETTLKTMREDQIDTILRFAVTWNQNSKHYLEAQKVLCIILKHYSMEDLLKLPSMMANLEGLLPYTERHYQRLNRMMQKATFVEYTWQRMKTAAISGNLLNDVNGE